MASAGELAPSGRAVGAAHATPVTGAPLRRASASPGCGTAADERRQLGEARGALHARRPQVSHRGSRLHPRAALERHVRPHAHRDREPFPVPEQQTDALPDSHGGSDD